MKSTTTLAIATSISLAYSNFAMANGHDLPCFQRIYSAEHMADHPEQTVSELTFWFELIHMGDYLAGNFKAQTADTPVTRETGLADQAFEDSMFCGDGQYPYPYQLSQCGLECGGTDVLIEYLTPDEILFHTKGISVNNFEGRCTSGVLQEGDDDSFTTYRLFLVPSEVCTGVGPFG
ncbi:MULTISPECIES: hypothetical protein [Rhodobacterales]|uniref:hypothetical protein n=1 Tax=Rhodobacterales TaxID=204455 RepID=UPI0011BD591A|nr:MULTISPECIES: hypothetical protein [Rhodobacterales]MDO6590612.1 hypothetical protein [Yoonia sp. 1_MG-2023]